MVLVARRCDDTPDRRFEKCLEVHVRRGTAMWFLRQDLQVNAQGCQVQVKMNDSRCKPVSNKRRSPTHCIQQLSADDISCHTTVLSINTLSAGFQWLSSSSCTGTACCGFKRHCERVFRTPQLSACCNDSEDKWFSATTSDPQCLNSLSSCSL